MVGARVNDSSSLNILLPSDTLHSSPAEMFESLWMPSSSTPFHGSHSMVSYDSVHEANATDGSFFQPIEKDENGEGEEELDVCFQQPGKKRRLSVDQVQFLEKNFEVENKLEPERKLQLAKELGLQPRQVAIWFQNRRARFKTKQLEKDYGGLKAKYDGLKSDYDCIQRENEKLNSEITSLKEKLKLRDQERKNSQLYCDEQINSKLKKPKSTSGLEKEPRLVARLCKFEDASSAKSDVMDSDSPHYRNNSPPLLEPADSSNMFGTEQSDEEENLSKNLLPPSSCFPKIEDCYYHDQPPVTTSSCNFGYSAEEQPFWFSPYE